MENYVVAFGLSKRRMFTKLRISSHSLAIEKGRHSKIPKSNDIVGDFVASREMNVHVKASNIIVYAKSVM